MNKEEFKEKLAEEVKGQMEDTSISRNFMRGIEDMVEQNDNNFDGVINNVNTELPDGLKAAHEQEQEQESVLEALKKAKPQPKESEEPKRIFPPELCL